ncbi:MAG: Holliday junction resolvase RuvX [Flavobacteriaceae bacterium]|nr:Holliday junction resolvase RuvX [Flavobacteriaceae bacterium]|tara:strand:- start:19000 stop:19422 length:423 start_codon:yes stop_codon:yes gene_type:complete
MGCLVAIDYGEKRTGIAHTDSLQLIASGLTTLPSIESIEFLQQYLLHNDVEAIIIGQPRQKDGTFSSIEKQILKFISTLKKKLPNVRIIRHDERFTSKLASQVIMDSGLKKRRRRNKSIIDKISATIILQSYLELKSYQK